MVICPNCGAEMVLRTTTKFTYPNGEPRKFYGCSKYPTCTGTHGAHPDGRPLGVPGNDKVKDARHQAHAAFDPLWKENHMTRKEAYAWMSNNLGIEFAHIGALDEDQCSKVIEMCKGKRKEFHMDEIDAELGNYLGIGG
jgi:ssDNA-binding Zn-finger/Zn-ribbon topoisomerase 1